MKASPLKTKNTYRQIIVAPEVIQMLKEKKEREDGFSPYVFSSPTGGPMCPDSMLHMLHRVLKRAGLEKIRFHVKKTRKIPVWVKTWVRRDSKTAKRPEM